MSTVNTGVNPAGMAITKCGKYIIIANNNNYNIEGEDSVSIIDIINKRLIQTIQDKSFNEPYTVTVNGKYSYITNSGGSTITIINNNTYKVVNTIDGFDGPSGMVIHRNIGYVNNYGATPGVGSGNGRTVSIVDLTNNKIIGSIDVGLAPAAISISPIGDYVYTVNYVDGNPNTGTISKIRTCDNKVVSTIGPGLSGPFYMVISDNGRYGYVTNFGSNNFEPFGRSISIVDLKRDKILKQIKCGIQPSGISLIPNSKYLCVTNYNTLYAYVQRDPPPTQYLNLTPGQGTLDIIDIDKGIVVKTIEVGQSPSFVVVTPDRKYICVTNYTSNTVNIININRIR